MRTEARHFATIAHEGQVRKGTTRPYITHPIEVAEIVSSMTDDDTLISAAYLHDTIEDCPQVDKDLIEKTFGKQVADLVSSESEDKSKTWIERKQATINRLKESPFDVQLLALADKLSNIRDMSRDYKTEGDNLWNRFRMKDKNMIGWYYKSIRDVLKPVFEGCAPYLEYSHLVDDLFGADKSPSST